MRCAPCVRNLRRLAPSGHMGQRRRSGAHGQQPPRDHDDWDLDQEPPRARSAGRRADAYQRRAADKPPSLDDRTLSAVRARARATHLALVNASGQAPALANAGTATPLTVGTVIIFAGTWDALNDKRRPGAIVGFDGDHVIVLRGTSQLREDNRPGHTVVHRGAAGLHLPTRFVANAAHRIPVTAIRRVCGRLIDDDLDRVLRAWQEWSNQLRVGRIVWIGAHRTVPGVIVEEHGFRYEIAGLSYNPRHLPLTDPTAARLRPGTRISPDRQLIELCEIAGLGGELATADLDVVTQAVGTQAVEMPMSSTA
jgi:hypothetical protein